MKPLSTLSLSGTLVFENVVQVLNDTCARMESTHEDTIDLSLVTHVDSAGLSLLLELIRRGDSRNAPVRFVNVPLSILRLAHFFEFDHALGFETKEAYPVAH